MYLLTVFSNDVKIRERVPYSDFFDAISACGEYYEPRAAGAVLSFTSEVIGKRFMRAYAQLLRMEDVPDGTPGDSPRAVLAKKQGIAFDFARSYTFLIESELGSQEADRIKHEDGDE